MRRILSSLAPIALLAMLSVPAVATADPSNGTSRVIPLGTVLHKGRLAEGFAFIHGRDNSAKPPRPGKTETARRSSAT